jgi:site-specific recombinase XerD
VTISRGDGLATKYKDGRGRWHVKYKDVDGKWKDKFCGTKASATDAETIRKNYDAIELNYRHKMAVRQVQANLEEQLLLFREHEIPKSTTGRKKSRKGIMTYQALVNTFVGWLHEQGYKYYRDITETEARAYIDYLVELGRSASNITKARQTLSKFWQWSILQNFAQVNPFESIPNPQRKKSSPDFYSHDELNEIFAKAKPPYDDIFRFLYLTGLRIGELGNLEWPDYIEAQAMLRIRVIEGNKTKREELLPINSEAVAIIEKRKGLRNSPDSQRYIFTNMEGLKIDNANIYRHLMVTKKACQITKGSPHTFRHTCASHLVIDGVSLYVVKDILRHASIRESEIYSHLTKDPIRKAIERLRTLSSSSQSQTTET